MNPMNISDPNGYATATTMADGGKPAPRPTYPVNTTGWFGESADGRRWGTRSTVTRGHAQRKWMGPDPTGYWGSRRVFI